MKTSIKNLWIVYLIPVLFVISNLVLKFLFITSVPIDHDEPFTIFYSQMSIPAMYKHLFASENNPLFFESLLHIWTQIFGISPFSVRFLSVVFSSFTVYVIYQLCRKNFNITSAVIASVIFTCSNYHLGFSHEARVYAMFAFLTTLSMYLFFELINHRKEKKYIILLGVVNLFLVYSHFFALFIPFVQLILCVFRADLRKSILKKYLYSCSIPLIGYLPMLLVMLNRFLESAGKGTWLPAAGIGELWYVLTCLTNGRTIFWIFVSILLVASIKYFVLKGVKVPSKNVIIILWFLLPFSIMFLVSLKYLPFNIPMFLERYMIHTSIPIFILVALALHYAATTIQIRWVQYSIYLVFFIFMIKSMHKPEDFNKMPGVVAKLNEYKMPNTLVCLAPEYYILNLCYNYDRSYFEDVDDIDPMGKLSQKLAKNNIVAAYNYNGIKKEAFSGKNRVIYVDIAAKFLYPDNHIVDSLSMGASNIRTFVINESRDVWVFDYPKAFD